MKKVILVLTIAFMFVAGSAFGAVMNKPYEYLPPSAMGGFDFDVTYNSTANTLDVSAAYNLDSQGLLSGAWQNSFSMNVTAPDANGIVYQTNWASAPGDFGTNTLTTFTGTAGIGSFTIHIFNFTYDTINSGGRYGGAPYWSAAHIPQPGDNAGWHYQAAPVPIPAAAWLLLSGLVGIIGLRRKAKHFGK